MLERLSGPLAGDGDDSGPSRRTASAAEATIENIAKRIPRPLHRRLSPAQLTRLLTAYESGARQKDLANQYGISVRSVKRLVRAAREAHTLACGFSRELRF